MDLTDRRFLVAGATGALGSRLARALRDEGAAVAVASRSGDGIPLELTDPASPAAAVAAAVEELGGLDGLVVATGAVAFGDVEDEVAARLFAVNALGPMALIRAARPVLGSPAVVVALSAVVAEFPTAGMAAYSASKAALSAYLAALRREVRRDGVSVLDVRPGHLDTPFASRALAGTPPKLPSGADPDEVVAAIVAALREGRRELAYDLRARSLVAT
jgi:NAD(P)-dependent dehydrogenase (short-subunit alcohol dehydrogenase family)